MFTSVTQLLEKLCKESLKLLFEGGLHVETYYIIHAHMLSPLFIEVLFCSTFKLFAV